MSRAFGSISMAIGKIEKEEAAEKEVNTTMGVNFLIIILGSNSPLSLCLSLLPLMGSKLNVIQLEALRRDIKTKAASNPRGLLLGLYCICLVLLLPLLLMLLLLLLLSLVINWGHRNFERKWNSATVAPQLMDESGRGIFPSHSLSLSLTATRPACSPARLPYNPFRVDNGGDCLNCHRWQLATGAVTSNCSSSFLHATLALHLKMP